MKRITDEQDLKDYAEMILGELFVKKGRKKVMVGPEQIATILCAISNRVNKNPFIRKLGKGWKHIL